MPDDVETQSVLREATERSLRFLRGLRDRRVGPTDAEVRRLDLLDGPVPDAGTDPGKVIRMLDEVGSPAAIGSAGGRYFGFVIGGALPAALGANWMAGAWNQNAAFFATSPGRGPSGGDLPSMDARAPRPSRKGAEGAFLTGDTMANFVALAAARHAVLAEVGWDVEDQGLAGAPPITVVVGEEVHATVLKAVSMLGLGRERVVRVPVDSQGRMRADALPRLSGPSIVLVQAGNVNGGGFDPIREIYPRAKESGAWVHVDGAFGLGAARRPSYRHLTEGMALADSWAADGHKWLNVPYDSGMVFVRKPEHLRAAMSIGPVEYLGTEWPAGALATLRPNCPEGPGGWRPGRRFAPLGGPGLADLVERTCRHASRIADGLRAAGYEVLNEVVLNQVVVAFGDDATTARVVSGVQSDGTCWCGGTRWQGRTAMRISVSSWATTTEDMDRSLAAILRVAADVRRRD